MSVTAVYTKRALTGAELEVSEDACILIEDEMITEVTTRREFEASGRKADEAILLEDKTVLPGLIECHN